MMNVYSPRVDLSAIFASTTADVSEATHIVCTDLNDYFGLLDMSLRHGCHLTVVHRDANAFKNDAYVYYDQTSPNPLESLTLWVNSRTYGDPMMLQLMQQYATGAVMWLECKLVLITGCLGFIGSRVLEHLFYNYPRYHFIGFDINSSCSNRKNVSEHIRNSGRYTEVIGDLCNKSDVERCFAFGHVNLVLHFAAESHVDTSFTNSTIFTLSNVYGTHVLIQQAYEGYVDKFIHVSTDEVYGDIDYTNPADEQALRSPTNPYAASKLGAEAIVQSYIKSFNFPAIITRGNNVYGPTQFCEKFIPKCIHRRVRDLPLLIHGTGSALRSFLYISDVVTAFDVIMQRGVVGTVYNIGSDEELSVMEVATQIMELTPQNGHGVEYIPDRCFNDKRYLIDSSRLHELGWSPQVSFADGLRYTLDWNASKDGQEYWSDDVMRPALGIV